MLETSTSSELEEYALRRLAESPLRVLRTSLESPDNEKVIEDYENGTPKPITNS